MDTPTRKPAKPVEFRQLLHPSPLIFEQGAPGRSGASLPALDVEDADAAAL